MPADHDLIVVGAGPAGRAVSFRAAAAGLRVVLIDPDPERPWRATYGAWTDELPGWLGPDCIATSSTSVLVYTPTRRRVERGYAVLATDALQQFLSDADVDVRAERAVTLTQRWVVVESGEQLHARAVVDARGGVVSEPSVPRQTAVGVRRRAVDAEMVVMDWRRPGPSSAPTFSYRVALTSSVELVEETCLAGAPPVGLADLATTSAARLGGPVPDVSGADADVELVDFALYSTRTPWAAHDDAPLRFGAAGGQMNPATGYSVATSLCAADAVVGAVRTGADPQSALWPRRARIVYSLRAAGLGALLAMDADELCEFFDVFFALPAARQRAYLSGIDDLPGLLRAMIGVFAGLPWHARLKLASTFGRGLRHQRIRSNDVRRRGGSWQLPRRRRG